MSASVCAWRRRERGLFPPRFRQLQWEANPLPTPHSPLPGAGGGGLKTAQPMANGLFKGPHGSAPRTRHSSVSPLRRALDLPQSSEAENS